MPQGKSALVFVESFEQNVMITIASSNQANAGVPRKTSFTRLCASAS